MSNEFKLREEIASISRSKEWLHAKLEWELENIYFVSVPETCLCGHYPIKEICVLRNRYNKNTALVGNYCVKTFMDLPSNNIFQAIKRIRQDAQKSLNLDTINYAFRKKWITDWECDFYEDIHRKRKLNPKQLDIKFRINQKYCLKSLYLI